MTQCLFVCVYQIRFNLSPTDKFLKAFQRSFSVKLKWYMNFVTFFNYWKNLDFKVSHQSYFSCHHLGCQVETSFRILNWFEIANTILVTEWRILTAYKLYKVTEIWNIVKIKKKNKCRITSKIQEFVYCPFYSLFPQMFVYVLSLFPLCILCLILCIM